MPVPQLSPPATIAANGTWTSGVIRAQDATNVIVAATLSVVGTGTLQRYVDSAGLIAVGDPITQALTADEAAWWGSGNSMPFGSYTIAIENTTGGVGNLSGVYTRFTFS